MAGGTTSPIVFGLVLQVIGAAVLAVLYPIQSPFYAVGIMLFEAGVLLSGIFLLVWMSAVKKIILGSIIGGSRFKWQASSCRNRMRVPCSLQVSVWYALAPQAWWEKRRTASGIVKAGCLHLAWEATEYRW